MSALDPVHRPASGPDADLSAPTASEVLLKQFNKPSFDSLPTDAEAPVKPPVMVQPEEAPKPAAASAAPQEKPAPDPAPQPDPSPASATTIPELDSFKLSPQAKPTTVAQFEGLKAAARARELKLKDELEAARAELEKIRSQSSSIPEDTQRELTELRAKIEATAIEDDPVFEAKWGAPLRSTEEKLLTTLKAHGADDVVIQQIRDVASKHGGLAAIDWDPIIDAYPGAKFSVMRHVGEYADAQAARKQAAEQARQNQTQWSETRKEALKTVLEGDATKHEEELRKQLDSLPLFTSKDPQTAPVIATMREKALGALRTESKANLAAGMATAFYWKHVADGALERLQVAEKNQPAELASAKKQVADLTKQNAELERELTKYRGANPRLGRPAAPPSSGKSASFVQSVKKPLGDLLSAHLKGA